MNDSISFKHPPYFSSTADRLCLLCTEHTMEVWGWGVYIQYMHKSLTEIHVITTPICPYLVLYNELLTYACSSYMYLMQISARKSDQVSSLAAMQCQHVNVHVAELAATCFLACTYILTIYIYSLASPVPGSLHRREPGKFKIHAFMGAVFNTVRLCSLTKSSSFLRE